MNATDNQKWAIVNSAKQFFDHPQLKDLKLPWKGLSFYNLPALSKEEASKVLNTLNADMFDLDMTSVRAFFVTWVSSREGAK